MTPSPTFSVVMPAYNVARTVGPAIESVLRQTCRDFELIVVDDGSTDDTAARTRPFEADARIRIIRHENRGLAAARNTGIAQATGDFISFLDSDDLWLPTYLEEMERGMSADPQAGIAYTDAWVLHDESRLISRSTAMSAGPPPPLPPPKEPLELLRLLVLGNFIFSSATVRRSVFAEVGVFDTRLGAAEDWEMWLRIVAHGHRAVRPPGLLAIYRWRRDSLSKDETSLLTNMRSVLRLVIDDYDVPDEIRVLARSRLRELDATLSKWGRRRAAVRRRASRAKSAVLGRDWYDVAPAEILAAFPDLTAV